MTNETQPTHIQIRQLVLADVQAVERLDHDIRGPGRSKTWDTYIVRVMKSGYLDGLPHPPWGCYVAYVDKTLVGFLVAERQMPTYGLPPGARIVALAVHDDFRRRGVARALVKRLEEESARAGLDMIYSVLLEEDERDAAFLMSVGFGPAEFKVYSRKI
jgi:ribosomal protein S18 acetylase RimI-like enzyme